MAQTNNGMKIIYFIVNVLNAVSRGEPITLLPQVMIIEEVNHVNHKDLEDVWRV